VGGGGGGLHTAELCGCALLLELETNLVPSNAHPQVPDALYTTANLGYAFFEGAENDLIKHEDVRVAAWSNEYQSTTASSGPADTKQQQEQNSSSSAPAAAKLAAAAAQAVLMRIEPPTPEQLAAGQAAVRVALEGLRVEDGLGSMFEGVPMLGAGEQARGLVPNAALRRRYPDDSANW